MPNDLLEEASAFIAWGHPLDLGAKLIIARLIRHIAPEFSNPNVEEFDRCLKGLLDYVAKHDPEKFNG